MITHEGYPFIFGATSIAAALYAAALRFRSWPFWLGALLVTIVALGVAWYYRNPARMSERGPTVVFSMDVVDVNVNRQSRYDVVAPVAHASGDHVIAHLSVT